MMKLRVILVTTAAIVLVGMALYVFSLKPIAPLTDIVVEDPFGRRLNERGVTVVNWEGYIANPAIQLALIPPTNAHLPAQAVLTADNPRFYFDLSPECITPPRIIDPCPTSTLGQEGPMRVVTFDVGSAQVVYISIFPSRTLTSNERYQLTIQFTDSAGGTELQHVPINVIAQVSKQPPSFTITLDFSHDTTGFFSDPKLGAQRRVIAQQAADDWAYYIDGTDLDAYIASPEEQTWVWNSTGKTGSCVQNIKPYKGLLIYVHGVDDTSPPYSSFSSVTSSANCPRAGRFTKHGIPVTPTMWRSGEISVNINGGYNAFGWSLNSSDNDWYSATNARNEPNDLYSTIHHEIAHVLGFNTFNSVMAAAIAKGHLDSPEILAYNGSALPVDSDVHFDNNPENQFDGTVDKISRYGAFGNEYDGLMPIRRWLITKVDLLALKAVGWNLRNLPDLVQPS
jgi:hypothetical protein